MALVCTATPASVAELPTDALLLLNGHSMIFDTQGRERAIRIAAGTTPSKFYEYSGGPAGLEDRWAQRNTLTSNGTIGNGQDGLTTPAAISQGDWDAFVTVLGIDGSTHTLRVLPAEYAATVSYFDLYYASNPSGQGYFQTFWNEGLNHPSAVPPYDNIYTPAQWRAELPNDQAIWEGHIAHYETNKASASYPQIRMIRLLELWGLIYDQIAASNGYSGASIYDIFRDNIHMSAAGSWVAGAMWAYTLFRIDPDDVSTSISTATHNFATMSGSVTADQKAFFAPLIRQVVDNDGYTL